MAQLEAALEINPQDKILGIVCNWCTYGGADNAGVSRMQYPTNLRLIRVMCTGRIARKFIERAFELGAGMVLVSGCHEGDCHYISGNQNMVKRENRITKWIEKNGIEPDRFRLEWISASEGTKFQKVVQEMADKLKELGPPSKIEAQSAEEVKAEE
jgi:heterodisulfide reductase subunit A